MNGVEAVGHEAAAHDQHTLVTQWREASADLQEHARLLAGHRHLEDRDVGLGVHRQQRHVRPVVQTAPRILGSGRQVRYQPADAFAQPRRTGRGIGHLVVPLGEAIEVVDQRHRRGRADHERSRLPVGRDDQDRLRARQRLCPVGELLGPERIVHQRRRAVAQVHSGRATLVGRVRGGDGGHGASFPYRPLPGPRRLPGL